MTTKDTSPDIDVTIDVTRNGDAGVIGISASQTKPIFFEKTVEYLYLLSFLHSRIAPLAGTREAAGDAILEKSGRWSIIEYKHDVTDLSSELAKYVPQALKRAKTAALRKLNIASRENGFKNHIEAIAAYAREGKQLPDQFRALLALYNDASRTFEDEVRKRKPGALASLLLGFKTIQKLYEGTDRCPTDEPHFFVYADVSGKSGEWTIGLKAQHYLGSWIESIRAPRYPRIEHLEDSGCSHEAFMYYLGVLIEAKTGETESEGSAGSIEYGTIVAASEDRMKVMTFNDFVDSYGYYSSTELDAKLKEKRQIIAQAQAEAAALEAAMSQTDPADVQSETSNGRVVKPKIT